MTYRVKAVTAVIKIGGSERYLHRGAIVPSAATNIEHLLAVGLLEEISLLEVPEADSPEDEQQSALQGTGGSGDGSGAMQLPAQSGQEPPAPPVTEPPVLPAKAGPGSSAEAWRNYAAALEVDVPADASREYVITALETAGKPTE